MAQSQGVEQFSDGEIFGVIDLVYLTKNRLEFTRQSWAAMVANTNWDLVDRLLVFDDLSKDGTAQFISEQLAAWDVARCPVVLRAAAYGGPVVVMLQLLSRPGADIFAKLDNDVVVPPGWLDRCMDVMAIHPELSLLGIEPPDSRRLTDGTSDQEMTPGPNRYVECNSIGGIGLMRRAAFQGRRPMCPHSVWGGFTEWQLRHKDVIKGWVAPSLELFLLDRMPVKRWADLSQEYMRRNWQRAWYVYPEAAAHLWSWWTPVESEVPCSVS